MSLKLVLDDNIFGRESNNEWLCATMSRKSNGEEVDNVGSSGGGGGGGDDGGGTCDGGETKVGTMRGNGLRHCIHTGLGALVNQSVMHCICTGPLQHIIAILG